MAEGKIDKEEVLTLLEIYGLSASNPKITAIHSKALNDLVKINADVQKVLDEEAKKEAEEKAAAELKAKEEAKAKAEEDAKNMEDAAKAASASYEKEAATYAERRA